MFPPLRLPATSREIRDSETESLRFVVEMQLERYILTFDPQLLHSDIKRMLTYKQNGFQSALPYEDVQRVL